MAEKVMAREVMKVLKNENERFGLSMLSELRRRKERSRLPAVGRVAIRRETVFSFLY